MGYFCHSTLVMHSYPCWIMFCSVLLPQYSYCLTWVPFPLYFNVNLPYWNPLCSTTEKNDSNCQPVQKLIHIITWHSVKQKWFVPRSNILTGVFEFSTENWLWRWLLHSLLKGCWKVSFQQQSFSGLQSPRWSFSIKVQPVMKPYIFCHLKTDHNISIILVDVTGYIPQSRPGNKCHIQYFAKHIFYNRNRKN